MQLIIFIMVSSCFAIDMYLVLKPKFFDRTYVAHGKLKPQKTSQVASKMSGQIVIRSIDIGQTVRKDQLLFELDPGTLPQEIMQVETEINKQKLQLAHHQSRYNRRTNNPDAYTEEGLELEKLQIERIKLEIHKLKTNRSMLQLKLDYKKIKAPFDGVITKLFKEVGDWVMLGGSTARIQSLNFWRIETEVPWHIYAQLKVGDIASISKAKTTQTVRIISKIPIVNPKTDQFSLELSFTSKDWQPSAFEVVPVRFSIRKPQLEIPSRYVKKELGTYQIKVVEANRFRWLSVEGTFRNGSFYPNNLDLENLTLKMIK